MKKIFVVIGLALAVALVWWISQSKSAAAGKTGSNANDGRSTLVIAGKTYYVNYDLEGKNAVVLLHHATQGNHWIPVEVLDKYLYPVGEWYAVPVV